MTDRGSAPSDTSNHHSSGLPIPSDLPVLALSRPSQAVRAAEALLASSPSAEAASYAHQALGIVLRDNGHLSSALDELAQALVQARGVDRERIADVSATFALTLAHAGRFADSERYFTEALRLSPPSHEGRVLMRRAVARFVATRYSAAAADIDRAIDHFHRAGDRLWEARSLNNRTALSLARGHLDDAARDSVAAGAMFVDLGQELEATHTVQNQGQIALYRGDLPTALALLQEACDRYESLAASPTSAYYDLAEAQLGAGLAGLAFETAVRAEARPSDDPAHRAELTLLAAGAAFETGDLQQAAERAESARRQFRAQRRMHWMCRAELICLQIRVRVAESSPDSGAALIEVSRELRRLVRRLRGDESPELSTALLLDAYVAALRGRRADASLQEAAKGRWAGTPLVRASAWLAYAQLARVRGSRRVLIRACRRGLDAVDEHRQAIGDIELRALATRYGVELSDLAIVDMVERRDARGVLWWAERWRATSLTGAVRPPDDPELTQDIAALRDVSRRLAAESDPRLDRERRILESAIRTRYRHLRATGQTEQTPTVPQMLDSLGEVALLCVVLVKDTLFAVTAVDGTVRLREVGPYEKALQEAEFARFTLRRAAFGRPVDLPAVGARLQAALLGPAARLLADREQVLVVPPASLLTASFGLIPTLTDKVVRVAPSITLWQKADRASTHSSADQAVALVTGPGLTTREQEVASLAAVHPQAAVLTGDAATVTATIAALDGVSLAHLAAHGTFRADAPLFSSLQLADGPLMVHDLDRLARPPARVVLSACDAGGVNPIGADEALGLVTSMLAMGTHSVVASVVPVNDSATVTVMEIVHSVVAQGGSLAQGLLAARRKATDPLTAATAAAFTTWGA